MALDKKLVASIIAASSLGFGAGQLVKLNHQKVVVHAVDLRVMDQPDGGTFISRKAWAHNSDKHDIGPGACKPLDAEESQRAQHVITDAESSCTW